MKDETFTSLVNKTTQHMRDFWMTTERHALNEQAVPSYLNPHRIVSYIFWKRIRIIIETLQSSKPKTVLDIGCGVGTLFLFLRELGIKKIYGLDTEQNALAGSQKLIEKHSLKNTSLLSTEDQLKTIPDESVEAILALDVLEHVESMDYLLSQCKRILTKNGQLLVSGPSENWLYKFARKLGGEHYNHHFHVRSIYDIRSEIESVFDVKTIQNIFPLITFFHLFKATNKSKSRIKET